MDGRRLALRLALSSRRNTQCAQSWKSGSPCCRGMGFRSRPRSRFAGTTTSFPISGAIRPRPRRRARARSRPAPACPDVLRVGAIGAGIRDFALRALFPERAGALGGQNKVPRVVNDPDLLRDPREFVGALTCASSSVR
jgi:hypothetical protein